MRPRLTPARLISLASGLVLVLTLVGPALAQPRDDGWGSRLPVLRGLPVHHGPVTVTLIDADSDGHQLGDLRTASVATTTMSGEPLGRLDATLTTTAVDVPAEGDEIRLSTLVFTFGDDGRDQVIVSGSAVYPAQGSTIATGSSTIRPIVGGSGRFQGVSGEAASQHLEDDSWVHWLRMERTRAMPGRGFGHGHGYGPGPGRDHGGGPGAERRFGRPDGPRRGLRPVIRERLREGIRELRAQVHARRAERRAELRAALRAERAGPDDAPAAEASPMERPAAGTTGSREVGITRSDLGIAQPGSAPGQELGLWRYVIPAGSELVAHTHAGWQIAHIVSGELEYTVLGGEGTIIRGDGSSDAIGPGTYVLEAGDAVVENPDLEHYGHNRTDAEVVIVAATLYEQGAPLSIPLKPTDDEASDQVDEASHQLEVEPEEEPVASPAA